DNRLVGILDRGHAEHASDPERRRLTGAKPTSSGSAHQPILVFTVQHPEILQPSPVHPAAVIGDTNLLQPWLYCHFYAGRPTGLRVLQTVRDIFPNDLLVSFENRRRL